MKERLERTRRAAETAGQGHLFRFWEQLEESSREQLLGQVEAVDWDLNARLAQLLVQDHSDSAAGSIEPPQLFPLRRDARHESLAARAIEAGQELLRGEKLGYVIVAGGQASRLGYAGPKGDFPIGPVSGRTLFEFHARRLLAARRRFGAAVPWYVMTSPANDEATRRIFAEGDHFGLNPDDVFFFSQAMLPALDMQGKILMSARDSLFLAPNGHGGVLAAMQSSGALADMRRRGLQQLSFFQVDNPLVRPADPLFAGLHAGAGAGMSSKVVAKRDAGEKVGVLGLLDGRMGCIEYSDLPDELREARDSGGELAFRAGNIAVHMIQVDFLEQLTDGSLDLPWHVARKTMKVVDERGEATERKGAKFETFVFDALGHSTSSVTLEVERSLEFSPVKNAEGEDSPGTAREALCRLHGSWIRAAGLPLPAPRDGSLPVVEVDPLLAESEEEFLAHDALEPKPGGGGHLYAP